MNQTIRVCKHIFISEVSSSNNNKNLNKYVRNRLCVLAYDNFDSSCASYTYKQQLYLYSESTNRAANAETNERE